MKKYILFALCTLFTLSGFHSKAQSKKDYKSKNVHVRSYTKKNGTHVRSHYRSH